MDVSNTQLVANLDFVVLMRSLGLAVLYALILDVLVARFSRIVGNRARLRIILVTLVPTMVLIISVVKSSLALSLGLVGALSIVRFRTPIKDAEELVYLFLAIAVGLGLGADQHLATTVCFFFIALIIVVVSLVRRPGTPQGVFLDLEANRAEAGASVSTLSAVFEGAKVPFELRRYSESEDSLAATYFVETLSTESLNDLLERLKAAVPTVRFTIIDRGTE